MKQNLVTAIGSVILAEAAGLIGTPFTINAIPTWYAYLTKPPFSPPSWLFAPVWTTLYFLMGVAAYRIWLQPASLRRMRALYAYFVQLFLNAIWTPIFFGLHAPLLGLIIIVAMLIATAFTIVQFWRIDRPAAFLLVPYLAWVSFATILNASIVVLNH